jgi:hypothetical protein
VVTCRVRLQYFILNYAANYESLDLRVKKLLLDYAAGKILMFSAWNGIKNESWSRAPGGLSAATWWSGW